MNIRHKDIIGCFPLLASVLGDRYGVDIRIGGDKAMTDGNIIYIPAMPVELDNETLEAAKGYVDHEAAHIRYTNFEAIRNAKLQKLEQWLFNAIEDWRVEGKLAEIFPGCGQNFRKLIKRLFGETTGAGRKNPALAALDYVLLSVRSWAAPEVAMRKDEAGQILDANFSGLKQDLDCLLMDVQNSCASTSDAIVHAQKLGACIRKYVNAHQKPKQEERRENTTADLEEGTQSGVPEPKSESSDCPLPPERENSTNPVGELENVSNPANPGPGLAGMDSLLASATESMPQNLGDMLSATLEAQPATDDVERIVVATVGDKTASAFSAEDKAEALQSTVAMRHRLAGLLQGLTLKNEGIGRSGKLASSCLHRICVGNARVFRHETEKIALAAAVHILMDCSSSMEGDCMAMANQACYALVKALAGIRGVNLAVTAFPTCFERASVYPAIRHGQHVKAMPHLEAFGDTPLGPALWWVMREMLHLKESRKIIIILTDGVPQSVSAAATAISQCQKLQMEVMGIGIQSAYITTLLPNASQSIWNLNELAPALFTLLQEALLKGERK